MVIPKDSVCIRVYPYHLFEAIRGSWYGYIQNNRRHRFAGFYGFMSSFEPTRNNAWEIPTVKKLVLSPSGVGFRGVSVITNP